nr:RHS repeat-associated core domain-containing protein [Aliidiomarina iranensis]
MFKSNNQAVNFTLASILSLTHKGYTGHEQVDHASVVQMGGRIYDAHIGRFLQADPFVQSPSNSQNFNRYSYVLNNPLSYTDPSGYLFKALKKYWRVIAAAAVSFYTFNVVSNWAIKAFSEGVLAGAVAGGTAGFMGGAVATGSLKGALQGAFSGAVFGAIGAQFGDAKTHVQVGAHSMAGGVLGKLHGGNFGHGFFSAGFTKWAGKEWKVDTESARNVIGNSLKQAIIGGTASKITGNKFSNGAFTAALQYIVNEAGSRIIEQPDDIDWSAEKYSELETVFDYVAAAEEHLRGFDFGHGNHEVAARWLHRNVHPIAEKFSVEIGANMREETLTLHVDAVVTQNRVRQVTIPRTNNQIAEWHSHAKSNTTFTAHDKTWVDHSGYRYAYVSRGRIGGSGVRTLTARNQLRNIDICVSTC